MLVFKNIATKDNRENYNILRIENIRLYYEIIANFPNAIMVFWLFRRMSLFLEMLSEINRDEVFVVFDLLLRGSGNSIYIYKDKTNVTNGKDFKI